jgi:hypothetical protein
LLRLRQEGFVLSGPVVVTDAMFDGPLKASADLT